MRPMLVFAALLTTAPLIAAEPANPLAGKWQVDLTTDPAKPYVKTMELQLAPDGTVTGSFYDSRIEGGQWKTDRGRTCVAFRTSDGIGPYHSSGCLRGGVIEGQTWAEHRRFLFNWNATRG